MKYGPCNDEWRIWEQNASPMFLVLTLNAGMRDLREYLGLSLWTSVVIFEERQAKWLFRPKELKLLGQKLIDFLMCPPYRVAFFSGYDKAEDALKNRMKAIQFDRALTAMSNEELANLFESYSDLYCRWYKYGWFCEPVQFQSQDILMSCFQKTFQAKQPDFDVGKATKALFTIEDDSFTVEILRHLGECAEALAAAMKIGELAHGIERVEKGPEFPHKASDLVLAAIQRGGDPRIRKLGDILQQHSERFHWKMNNYYSTQFLTAKDVLVELFSSSNATPAALRAQVSQAEENKKTLLGEKSRLLDELPAYLRSVAVLASTIGGVFLDRRKRTIMMANAAFDRILSDAARRSGLPLDDCRFLIPQELRSFLGAPQEYAERLKERRKGFVVFQGEFALLDELFGDVVATCQSRELKTSDFFMPDPFIAEGEPAQRLLDQLNDRLGIFSGGEINAAGTLHGTAAYYDETVPDIEGLVRIIRDPKSEKLSDGEILVAPSTTPDYMDAIRRCKAIVTDWGGQTSHAAIVSRELHKPCIIGTNFASQILRTGDSVRLHFRPGTVEKLIAQ